MKVEIKILDPRLLEHGVKYATQGSAAIDLRACSLVYPACHTMENGEDGYTLFPGETIKIGTGIAVHLGGATVDGDPIFDGDPNTSLASMLLPRSGIGSNNGIVLGNLVGLVDSDYQGEVIVCMWNRSDEAFTFKPLERIAQMLVVPVLKPEYVVVAEFGQQTERGAGGFGSTGKK